MSDMSADAILLLDVDNTLYSRSCGIVPRIDVLIDRFCIERVGFPADEVGPRRRALRAAHGTTLRGLMHSHGVDPDDYLAFVHAIEITDVLRRDQALRAMLARIPLPKVAVTNASTAHAHAVLDCLGVRDAFRRVYSLEDMAYVPKPFPESFQAVLADLATDPECCILVEDSLPNLTTARELGMRTVYVSDDGSPDAADVVIPSIHGLEDALASLLGAP